METCWSPENVNQNATMLLALTSGLWKGAVVREKEIKGVNTHALGDDSNNYTV